MSQSLMKDSYQELLDSISSIYDGAQKDLVSAANEIMIDAHRVYAFLCSKKTDPQG